MKRKDIFLIELVLLVCTSIIALWNSRGQPLCSVLPDDDMKLCVSNGYYDGMESVVAGAIPQEKIAELFNLTTIKKGMSYTSLPSPCFEIRAVYDDETYIVVAGADRSVSVASVGKPDGRTFWVDTGGELFERLYRLHLENGGTEFP